MIRVSSVTVLDPINVQDVYAGTLSRPIQPGETVFLLCSPTPTTALISPSITLDVLLIVSMDKISP